MRVSQDGFCLAVCGWCAYQIKVRLIHRCALHGPLASSGWRLYRMLVMRMANSAEGLRSEFERATAYSIFGAGQFLHASAVEAYKLSALRAHVPMPLTCGHMSQCHLQPLQSLSPRRRKRRFF